MTAPTGRNPEAALLERPHAEAVYASRIARLSCRAQVAMPFVRG